MQAPLGRDLSATYVRFTTPKHRPGTASTSTAVGSRKSRCLRLADASIDTSATSCRPYLLRFAANMNPATIARFPATTNVPSMAVLTAALRPGASVHMPRL